MERFLLPSKRSRNCSLVPGENENINVNLPDVENVSDVDSETEESLMRLPRMQRLQLVQLQVDISSAMGAFWYCPWLKFWNVVQWMSICKIFKNIWLDAEYCACLI